jgi:phosphatidylglycerophosphatase A
VNVRIWLLTGCGLGLLKPAPGSWGSLATMVVALAFVWLVDAGGVDVHGARHANITIGLIGVAFAIACLKFGAEGEAYFGVKDPSQVVADEVAGQAIVLLALPWRGFDQPAAWTWNLSVAMTALVMFRIFDIAKPPPIRGVQSLPGGAGILLDDVTAGLFALAATQIVTRLVLPHLIA